jgi:general secretion pathway protein A
MQESIQTVLDFFGLQEQPFAATADPAYFYASREHKECLFRLWNCVDERQGIVVVLGNYGTGKTTLLRKLLTGMRANENYNTAVIASPIPSWTTYALLESILAKFRVPSGERSFTDGIETLNHYLLKHRDRINTLIIDDAQNLNKRGQLELLRLVQNLETPQHKLLNLVFFAQLEWVQVLRAAPNFLQRASVTYTLSPINVNEVGELIQFRLRQAGAGVRAPVFDRSAIDAIAAYTTGSPRLIINLCRNALMLAAHLRTRRIGQSVILHTIQKTMLPDEDRMRCLASPARPASAPDANDALAEKAAPANNPTEDTALNKTRANKMLLRATRGSLGHKVFPDDL